MKNLAKKMFNFLSGKNQLEPSKEEVMDLIIAISKKETNDFHLGERVRTIIEKFNLK